MKKTGIWLICFAAPLAVAPYLLVSAYAHPKMLMVALGAMLLAVAASEQGNMRTPPLFVPAALCLIILALSFAFSCDKWLSLFGTYRCPFYSVLTLLACATIYYSACQLEVTVDDIGRPALLATMLMCLYSFLQMHGIDPCPFPLPMGRATSTMGSPVFLGAVYSVALPIILSMRLSPVSKMGAVVAVFASLVCARSKGGLLACLAVSVFYGLWNTNRDRRRFFGVIFALMGAAGGIYYFGHLGESDLMRLELNTIAWRIFTHNPVLGSGPETFLLGMRQWRTDEFVRISGSTKWVQASAHNDIMQALATTGLVGLLTYLFLWWQAVRLAVSQRNLAVLMVLAGLFIQSKFNPIPIPVYAIVALVLAALRDDSLKEVGISNVLNTILAFACLLPMAAIIPADYFYSKAVRYGISKDYEKAIKLSPGEREYRAKYVDALISMRTTIPRAREGEARALNVAVEGALKHPNDPFMHQIAGRAAFNYRVWGGIRFVLMARKCFAKANRLDPKMDSIISDRKLIEQVLLQIRRHHAARANSHNLKNHPAGLPSGKLYKK